MSDWDEIKRLAADFQKIQLSSTLQKLSEPNCIEVVNLLIEQQLINVIYTIDGKEYITPEHFRREVEDELYAHGGRASAVALAKALHVDVARVQLVAEQMAAEPEAGVHFVLGQLMTDAYLQRCAAEINDQLAQKGEVSVFELASQHYDLPTDFLLEHVMQRFLGTIIQAHQDAEDGSKFFTPKYIARCRSRLRGAMAGLTLPTPVAQFFTPIGQQEAMLHQLVAELGARGVVTSRQKGALYIPTVYTQTQTAWVDSFWRQNGYVEYEAMARLGVTAAPAFVKRQLAAEVAADEVVFLDKCCVALRLVQQVEAALDECVATGSYLDVTTVLPSAIGEEDVAQILERCMKGRVGMARQKATQLFGTTILTTKFIDDLVDPCTELATAKGRTAVESGRFQQYLVELQLASAQASTTGNKSHADADIDIESRGDRKDDRRRKAAAGGKSGGGTQGRESKTRATKKHYRGGRGGGGARDADSDADSDDDRSNVATSAQPSAAAQAKSAAAALARLDLVTAGDIERVIQRKLDAEGLDYLARPLAEHFVAQFTRLALTTAQTLHEASVQKTALEAAAAGHTGHGQTAADRRSAHAELQERLNNALVDIRLYDRGLRLLPAAQHAQLTKYLLKTLATDVANQLHVYAATESKSALAINEQTLTPELRTKLIGECDKEYRPALLALNKTLAAGSVEEFLAAADEAMQQCSMIVKRADKKRERQLVLCHKHGLLEQLAGCEDAALVLHLAALVVFTVSAQAILHASGKHVSALLQHLQPVLGDEEGRVLRRFHDLVLRLLSAATQTEEGGVDLSETQAEIAELQPKVKQIAAGYKKSGGGGAVAAE